MTTIYDDGNGTKLYFVYGYCETVTNSGKEAVIWRNEFNLKKPLYFMAIDGNIVFSRGTIQTAIKKLKEN